MKTRPWMKRLVLSIAVVSLVIAGCNRSEPPKVETAATISTHNTVVVWWEKDFEGALARATAEDKAVLVNFYAEWCVWCKRMESTTLRDGKVASVLNKSVVSLSLNVEGDGEELSSEYGVDALPTVLVLDTNGKELGRIPGYLPPASFLEAVQGLLGQS